MISGQRRGNAHICVLDASRVAIPSELFSLHRYSAFRALSTDTRTRVVEQRELSAHVTAKYAINVTLHLSKTSRNLYDTADLVVFHEYRSIYILFNILAPLFFILHIFKRFPINDLFTFFFFFFLSVARNNVALHRHCRVKAIFGAKCRSISARISILL